MKKVALTLVGLTALFAAACTPVQSDACIAFLECNTHYASETGTDEAEFESYGAEGDCWTTTQEDADDCSSACEEEQATFKATLETDALDVGACE
ncbi:MAG: hypothetical protein GY822_31860 [Deltaproteobacteria bacterium]|nr:hypothetical protein [Deltaproteobacteria bacterium]